LLREHEEEEEEEEATMKERGNGKVVLWLE